MTRDQFIANAVPSVLGDSNKVKLLLGTLAGKVYDLFNPVVETITANRTLVQEDSGKIFLVGTDALIVTLPSTVAGLKYEFINSGAAGNNILQISPAAADGISGTITLASSVVVDAGVVNKDLINTKATSKSGDKVSLIGTGVAGTTAWIIQSSTGIWAAEA